MLFETTLQQLLHLLPWFSAILCIIRFPLKHVLCVLLRKTLTWNRFFLQFFCRLLTRRFGLRTVGHFSEANHIIKKWERTYAFLFPSTNGQHEYYNWPLILLQFSQPACHEAAAYVCSLHVCFLACYLLVFPLLLSIFFLLFTWHIFHDICCF